MSEKIWAKVYFAKGFDEEVVDEICDNVDGSDFWYGYSYARYKGTGEGLEEFKRLLAQNGVQIEKVWIH